MQDELKTGSEILGNLEARLSLGKKFLDELVLDTLPAARQRDDDQGADLNRIEATVE